MKKLLILILFFLTLNAANSFASEFYNEGNHSWPEMALPELFVKEEPIVQEPAVEPALSEDKVDDKVDDNVEVETEVEAKSPSAEDDLAYNVLEINSIEDDEQKVKKWAKISSAENYLIINKKDCSAIVYDKDGNELTRFEIGVGKEIGDDFNDTSGLLGKSKNTTPAGEFTLIPNIFNKLAYGDLTLSLGAKANKAKSTKKVVALHKVPKFRQKDRLKKFHDGNLANNRMSHGCINFLEDDFKELTKYIKGGFKVYVLPEEKDNKLMLTKNDKDEFELSQTKY